jgi:raffinose/stachyose/melibiose transport system permease protein
MSLPASRSSRMTSNGVLLLFMVFTALPLLSMLSTALAPDGSVPQGLSWPRHPHWHNFVAAWNTANMFSLLKSSTLIVLGVVPASVVLATLAGYGLAKLHVPGGKYLYALFLLGLTLPIEALITPLYYQSRELGIFGTRWAIILPLIGLYMSFGVFWMRTHFLATPPELDEAAQLDGASTSQAFRQIQLPLAAPAWSSLTILFFLWTWNQFLLALVLVNNPSHRTMAGGLGVFQGQYGTDIVLLCAASLLIMTPSLVVFVVFQRHFVKALLQGAIK